MPTHWPYVWIRLKVKLIIIIKKKPGCASWGQKEAKPCSVDISCIPRVLTTFPCDLCSVWAWGLQKTSKLRMRKVVQARFKDTNKQNWPEVVFLQGLIYCYFSRTKWKVLSEISNPSRQTVLSLLFFSKLSYHSGNAAGSLWLFGMQMVMKDRNLKLLLRHVYFCKALKNTFCLFIWEQLCCPSSVLRSQINLPIPISVHLLATTFTQLQSGVQQISH